MTSDPYFLRITFCDTERNGFVDLGGAEFEVESNWHAAWAAVPTADRGWDDPAKLCLDKIDKAGDRVDEKPISAAVMEQLLGLPLAALVEAGRAKTCFTWGQWKAMQQAQDQPSH